MDALQSQAMAQAQQILPFKVAPLAFEPHAQAIRSRVAKKELHKWEVNLIPLINAINDSGYFCHPFPKWHFDDPRAVIQQAQDPLASLAYDGDEPLVITGPRLSFQTSVYQSLLPTAVPFSPLPFLRRRIAVIVGTDNAEYAGCSSLLAGHKLVGAPGCLLSAVLKLWLNAWPLRIDHSATAAYGKCSLCQEWLSTPTIRHLSQCSVVKSVCCTLGVPRFRSVHAFLLLSPVEDSVFRKRAAILYALHAVLCVSSRCRLHDPADAVLLSLRSRKSVSSWAKLGT